MSAMSGFIVDDVDDELLDEEDDDSNEAEDLFDSVCAFCDNGGNILWYGLFYCLSGIQSSVIYVPLAFRLCLPIVFQLSIEKKKDFTTHCCLRSHLCRETFFGKYFMMKYFPSSLVAKSDMPHIKMCFLDDVLTQLIHSPTKDLPHKINSGKKLLTMSSCNHAMLI